MSCTLVLGGVRSGKSAYAEARAHASGKEVVYIATARAGDSEMAARIAHHQRQRPSHWITVEEPLSLADTLLKWSAPGRVVLVDCLTLWLNNLMHCDVTEYPDVGPLTLPAHFQSERAALLRALTEAPDDVILVSNELGSGIVPLGAFPRSFADEAGRLNQDVVPCCDKVVMLIAGLPLTLK